jgi:hypothetical protein
MRILSVSFGFTSLMLSRGLLRKFTFATSWTFLRWSHAACGSSSLSRAATAFSLAWTPSSAQEHRPSCFSQLDARSTPLVRVRSFSQRRDM